MYICSRFLKEPLQNIKFFEMNLYIRFFDDERVVTTTEEALEFIHTFQGFNPTKDFDDDFRKYAESDVVYPKRYKVRPRVYFIVIKTTATTLEEFKANGRNQTSNPGEGTPAPRPKDIIVNKLLEERPGWYEGTINFKRVVFLPETGKCDYFDTSFSAILKAWSPMDCYNRLVDYIHHREDIDERSQMPSPKGRNFIFHYIGLKPLSALNI